MNRTPETIYQYYSTEADARGGRFTRKCAKGTKATAPKWSESLVAAGAVRLPKGKRRR